jgi:ABC-type phosphonate transport system ATPase subunit
MRTDWGFVRQNPADGLRMAVSAGGNVGERLMAVGARHYGNIRAEALSWLAKVEIEEAVGLLLDKLPNLRLDPDYPRPVVRGVHLRGPEAVHVIWDIP